MIIQPLTAVGWLAFSATLDFTIARRHRPRYRLPDASSRSVPWQREVADSCDGARSPGPARALDPVIAPAISAGTRLAPTGAERRGPRHVRRHATLGREGETQMPTDLTPKTIAIVKSTVPVLEEHGLAITRRMYERMFRNEEIRDLFNQSHHGEAGDQPRALAAAIIAYAQNIEGLAALAPAVERIAQKHVGLNIVPEHYPHVADALLGAIADVLGPAASEEVLEAWGEAYWYLAEVLIARERRIYSEQAEAEGGWNGWRDFVVADRTRESDVITSFVLRPADGGAVMRHRPGQYLTFWLDVPGHHPLKRNYSISSAPDHESYRISVKREPLGAASRWLHDEAKPGTILKVSPPAGEFFLPRAVRRPVVLMSGGVGLTPMISMLETIARDHPGLRTHFVHGTQDGTTHAMGRHVREVAAASSGRIVAHVFYEAPKASDRKGSDYDETGRISVTWLERNTPIGEADYYICGPRAFLRAFVGGLAHSGVPATRIHYEFFGPADELLAA
jgi:nitric oxide dioxygenase